MVAGKEPTNDGHSLTSGTNRPVPRDVRARAILPQTGSPKATKSFGDAVDKAVQNGPPELKAFAQTKMGTQLIDRYGHIHSKTFLYYDLSSKLFVSQYAGWVWWHLLCSSEPTCIVHILVACSSQHSMQADQSACDLNCSSCLLVGWFVCAVAEAFRIDLQLILYNFSMRVPHLCCCRSLCRPGSRLAQWHMSVSEPLSSSPIPQPEAS